MAGDEVEVESFVAATDPAALEDLRARLRDTRWPDRETVDDWSQGVPLDYVREVCRYWLESYDWNRALDRVNALPNFHTPVDGLDIHFIHARSRHDHARPLVLTHGWPGSIFEFLEVIPRLTDPAAYGLDPAIAFHVVAPSLPGYGFSAKPDRTGWNVQRIAAAWQLLMARLGYRNYFAQGGDWGATITSSLALHHPAELAGIHLNAANFRPEALKALPDRTEAEALALRRMAEHRSGGGGYSKQQSTHPQSLGYGLADSPVGQCAWILEKFHDWTDNDGDPQSAITLDQMLDDITLYWLTNTATSSARLYWESFASNDDIDMQVTVPTAYSLFPAEITRPSRRWLETRFLDLRYYNVVDRGGHFAALEQPALFADELRAGLSALAGPKMA